MSKLFRLREWLTLGEAAQRLSIVFGEDVKEATVLRLALDGHLRLSVRFVNAVLARRGKVIPYNEAFPEEDEQIPIEQRIGFPGIPYGDEDALDLSENNIEHLQGIYDLSMFGAERLDVEHKYQQLTGGIEVTDPGYEVLVVGIDGAVYQIQKNPESYLDIISGDYHEPMDALPEDSVIVVRTKALNELEQSLSGSKDDVEAMKNMEAVAEIKGPSFNRLRRAIEAFPGRYPDYQTRPPKLDDDVRLWLKEARLADNNAERRVFGAIIREHFQLSPDTLKTL